MGHGERTAVIDEFRAAVQGRDDQLDLALAALLIGRIVAPLDDPRPSLALLDEEATAATASLRDVVGEAARARALGAFLGQERGYRGDAERYYDPANSCLNLVLARKTGLPITLAVLYLEVGWRLGLPLVGVGFPGHFLVKTTDEHDPVILDPFAGGVALSLDDCAARLRAVHGRPLPMEPHYLAAVTRRQILIRMLNNLKYLYTRPPWQDARRALATVEHLLAISPWALDEMRDRGLLRASIGEVRPAVVDLETYLAHNAEAEDAGVVRALLETLTAAGDPS